MAKMLLIFGIIAIAIFGVMSYLKNADSKMLALIFDNIRPIAVAVALAIFAVSFIVTTF